MEVTDEEIELGEIEELELKYCERCGALWLRTKGCEQVYCAPCVPKMAQFAVGKPRGRGARLPVGKGLDLQAVVDAGFASPEEAFA